MPLQNGVRSLQGDSVISSILSNNRTLFNEVTDAQRQYNSVADVPLSVVSYAKPANFITYGDKPIDPNAETFVLTHGLNNTYQEPWIQDAAKTLRQQHPNANIVMVDWDSGGANPVRGTLGYPIVAANTRQIGEQLGNYLATSGVNGQKTTLVGHSLGAQVSGVAGRQFRARTGQQLGTIVGLDPAGPLFNNAPNQLKLDRTDARNVVGIHTSRTFGTYRPVGSSDYFINPNSLFQPGAFEPVGNHGYATVLYNDLLKGGRYRGIDRNAIANPQANQGAFNINTHLPPEPRSGRGIPRFGFDNRSGRYRYQDTGKFVSRQAVDYITRKRISLGQTELGKIAKELINKTISIRNAHKEALLELKALHTHQYLLGRGGSKNMTPEDYQELNSTIQEQAGHLQNFFTDIANGTQSPARIEQRMKAYGGSGTIAMRKGEMRTAQIAGYKEMLRELGITDQHCSDCVGYANLGWQPITTLPLPMQQCQCHTNCKCTVRYR